MPKDEQNASSLDKAKSNMRLMEMDADTYKTISDTQLRLNCVDLATRCDEKKCDVMILADKIYKFVTNE